MADIGQWGGLQLRIDIPPEIRSFVDGVNGIFEVAITALDIALTVLNVVKAFVSGLLNLVRQLVQELIKLIQNLLLDFRQVGFYANFGDVELLTRDTTFDSIRGGYAGYQNRMITRLLDRNDLTRPNLSASSGVIALFFYVGVNLTFVDQLRDPSQFRVVIDLCNGLAQLFGGSPPFTAQSNLPVPVGVAPAYAQAGTRLPTGTNGATALILATTLVAGRNTVSVRWNIAPPPSASSSSGPVVPPDGFLVEVSCFPQGLYAGWLAPSPSSTGGPGGDGAPNYTSGFYTDGQTGEPLQVFGGVDSIRISDEIKWSNSFDTNGELNPGATPLFFTEGLTSTRILRSDVIQVRGDGRHINQRTFYVGPDTVRAQTWGTSGTYFLNIPFDQMPLKAVPNDDGAIDPDAATVPDQVWVRVLSCDDKIEANNDWKWDPRPHRTPTDTRVLPVVERFDPLGRRVGPRITLGSRGTPSDVITVMISQPQTDRYILGLSTAIAIALLSRSDIVPPSSSATGVPVSSAILNSGYAPTGLESVSVNLIPVVLNVRSYLQGEGTGPVAFSEDLRNKVTAMAQFLVETQGNLPPTLLATLAETIDRLLVWKWSDTTVTEPDVGSPQPSVAGNSTFEHTILDALSQGASQTDGETAIPCIVTKNIRCLSTLNGELLPEQARDITILDSRAFRKYELGTYGSTTILDVSESAPVLQDGEGNIWYIRDVIPPSVYEDARTLLQIAGVPVQPSTAGSWISWRPFVGFNTLSSLNNVIAEIERWASILDAGLQGIADQILAFIDAIEQRISEIQELIRRIQSYLNIPLSITVPDALFLPLVVAGTEGVVTGLATATNQPSDGPDTYSGGAVILMGGLPAIIQDLILFAINEANE